MRSRSIFAFAVAFMMLFVLVPASALARGTGGSRPLPSLDDALNSEYTELVLHFETEGAYPFEVGADTETQIYAGSTNAGAASSVSSMSAAATFNPGDMIFFYYYLESEANYDFFRFKVDGATVLEESGETGILLFTYTVELYGSHTLEWSYTKDSTQDYGIDMVKIYEVRVDRNEDPPMPPLDDALNSDDTELQLHFENSNVYPFAVGADSPSQYFAASTNVDVDSSMSWVGTEAYFNANDVVSFYYYLESEENYDVFRFSVDGEPVLTESGDLGLLMFTYTFASSGNHELQWSYTKDSNGHFGIDRVKIYAVRVVRSSSSSNPGDANGDGSVDMADALLVLRYAMGIVSTLPDLSAADADNSGAVDVGDALLILRAAMGIITL